MSWLEVDRLSIDFATREGTVQVLRDVVFSLEKGQTLGVVGESGSGKSVTSLALLGLLANNANIRSGAIRFEGTNLLELNEKKMRDLRGRKISMIFQDPMSSLDPCYTVGDQIKESLAAHTNLDRAGCEKRVVELLKLVGIPDPEKRQHQFPHEMSGGMSQRVMIAMALACGPELLIADEPTTALDVTIQAQIMALLRDLQKQNKMALILISHDLGLIAENVDHLVVMYAGEVVESGPTKEVLKSPQHPYTRALLNAMPAMALKNQRQRLESIPGVVPDLRHRPAGCQFAERCPKKQGTCDQAPHLSVENNRSVRCWYPHQ